MNYGTQWERMRRQTKELENKAPTVFALNNPYGFKLNISHPEINKKFENFKRSRNIGRHGMRDELRREFEELMMNSSYFKKLVAEEAKRYGEAYEYIKMHGCYPKELKNVS